MIRVNTGDNVEQVYDFRIQYPTFCKTPGVRLWEATQNDYEEYHDKLASCDNRQEYLDEIDSVSEIYQEEFHVSGRVLDIGGHQGRLRHFLSEEDRSIYISIDPCADVFANIQYQYNLLSAYPCLSTPCNFVLGHAESLPFAKQSFDWVHMRSVLDHFSDPYRALLEAHRVLKPEGRILVGLAIVERIQSQSLGFKAIAEIRKKGILGLLWKGVNKLKKVAIAKSSHDDHIFRFSSEELIDLLNLARFNLKKQHWQKPPFSFCIYLEAALKTD